MTKRTSPFHLSPAVARDLAPSPTLFINERVNQMWAAGERVYHLGFGESRFPVHPLIQEALRENAHRKSYLAGQGLAELRDVVADFYGRQLNLNFEPGQIIVGPGSKSLIYALQMALDAELILPTPCWVSYAPQAHLLKKEVRHVFASPREEYALRLDELDRVVQSSTASNKMLLLTSPNNPTGAMYGANELQSLAAYCREHQLTVLSDEIYGLIPHEHSKHLSMAHYYPEGTVVLTGLSKHLSLGGWRLGVGIVPAHDDGRRLMAALRVIASEIWSTPTGPIQYAALTAYGSDPAIMAYIAECTAIHAIRTQYLWQAVTGAGLSAARPAGGFYLYPNLDHYRPELAELGVHTSTDLAAFLLNEFSLATLPGTAFNTPADDLSLRLASSYLDMETDEAAEAILTAYRRDPDPTRLMRDHHPMMQAAIGQFAGLMHRLGAK